MASETLDQLQPAVGYPAWVWLLSLGLLAIVAAWFIWMFWWLRRKARADQPQPSRPLDAEELATLRNRFLEELESHRAAYAAGTLDRRGLHLKINHVLRDFATARGELDARPLTAAELARMGRAMPLATALAAGHEPAFAMRTSRDADAALAAAKEVITTW